MKKKMTKNKIVFIIIFLFSIFRIEAQEIWTLEKCIERAIEKNISIKQIEADLKITRQNKKVTIGNFLPGINATGNHSWNIGLNQNITTGILENLTTQTTSLNANINMDIFNGLQNIQQIYKSNLSILSSKYQLNDMKDDISLLIANSYLQILFNKENLSIQESYSKIAQEELVISKERFNSGFIPKGDVLELEANLATSEQNLIIAKNNYTLSKLALAQLLRITNFYDFKIEEKEYIIPDTRILDSDINTIYHAALKTRNDIKLAETNLKIATKDLSIAKSQLLPSISAFYSYNSRVIFDNPASFNNQLDANAGENFGLQITVPIFNRMTNNVNVQINKIKKEKSFYTLEQTKLDLENTINEAYYNTLAAKKTYEAAQKTLFARETSYKNAKERFNNGAINTFDFLQAQQRFENAQSDFIKTKYDFIFKIKVLEFYFIARN